MEAIEEIMRQFAITESIDEITIELLWFNIEAGYHVEAVDMINNLWFWHMG